MLDQQAKTSLLLESTSYTIPFSNFKPSINKYNLNNIMAMYFHVFGLVTYETMAFYETKFGHKPICNFMCKISP